MGEKAGSQRTHLVREATGGPGCYTLMKTLVLSLPLSCATLPGSASDLGLLSWCSPVVALGQLVGHWHEGQSPVFLRTQRVADPAPVDQAPFLELHEGLDENLVLVLLVQAEGLQHSRHVSKALQPAGGHK